MIASQATRLSEVTESVLLAGRLDRDEIAIDRNHIDVNAVVHDAVDVLRKSLPETVSIEEQFGHTGQALGDAARLQQVLINLVDNAVKYSPGGGIVTVATSREIDRVRIVVSDEGAGIADGDRDRVFEKFFRGDPTHRLVPGGTGLGLYISRELVERMGGRIALENSSDTGSTFAIALAPA